MPSLSASRSTLWRPAGRLWVWLAAVLLMGMALCAFAALYFLNALGGGGVAVETTPDGASVMVNGRLAGATPLKLKGLSSGTYALRIEKAGCVPVNLKLEVSATGSSQTISQTLQPVPLGTLIVNIKPDDAEVLVDGDLMGHTPLRLENVPVGPHELLVRKTNYTSYSQRFDATPGQQSAFDGINLNDKILELLESQVKSEPQRIGHYIDLAHYYFTNDRMEEAALTFAQAEQVSSSALNFDGAGFAGRDKMSPEEITVEQRLRREDDSRLPKEIQKHREFPRKDTRPFRMKLREAEDDMRRLNLKSFASAERSASEEIKAGNYDRAARAYQDFIEAARPLKSPDLPLAYIKLIETFCMKADIENAMLAFDRFYDMFSKDGPMLRSCGHALYPYHVRFTDTVAKGRLLAAAEKALRAGIALPADADNKAQSLFDLGMALFAADKFADSAKTLRLSVDQTRPSGVREDRMLKLAEALSRSGDKPSLDAAVELLNMLKISERQYTRDQAAYLAETLKQIQVKP